MSLHCTFLFPKRQFELVFMSTIGYISDNMFYRLNFLTGETQIQLNPHGRSYQAFTSNHKRGIYVLADYGRNPNLSFNFLHKKQQSFEIKDLCALEIDKIVLSLDAKYLLVNCGVPQKQIIIVDVQNRKELRGQRSRLFVGDKKIIKIQFNPANNKIFAIMFENQIQIYQINETYQSTADNQLQQCIQILKKGILSSTNNFQTFIWDQLNNIYASNGKNVFVHSTDTQKQVISYDLEGDFDGQVISTLLLTPKHLILVYCNGRIEWINKFYPDLLQEEEIYKKPFYLDKFYQFTTPINYALYDHKFTKIFIAHKNGFFSVLIKQAESHENQDEDEDNKQARANRLQKNKKLDVQVNQVGPFHANHIVFCREVKDRAILMSISKAGRIIFWSIIQKKPIAYSQTTLQVVSADVNENFTILCTSNRNGVVQFYSIADFTNLFLFKQFKLVQKGQINQVQFSSNSQQLACLSTLNKRVFYLLTEEKNDMQILGYVNLPYQPLSICWNKTNKTLVKPKYQHLLCCIGFGILMINGPASVNTKLRGKDLQLNCDIYALRTDIQQKLIQVLPSGEILTTGTDKILKKYKQVQDPISKFNPQVKTSIPPPLQQIQSHDLQTTFMRVFPKMFVSGGAEGALEVRSLENFNSVKYIQVNGWKNTNLYTGGASEIDGLYFACGKDGALSMWKTKDNIQIKKTDELKRDKSSFTKIKSEGLGVKFFEVAIQDQYLQKMKDTITKKKKDQLDKINKIKTQLKHLLAQNQTHNQQEKLSRDEFVIDLESRDKATKEGEQKCQKIKKQSSKNVLYNEVYRNKLKQITWNTMQQHLKAINGLKNNYLVYNYQIRKIGNQQKRKLQLIMDLRRNQIKQIKKRGKDIIDAEFYKNKNVINGGILQPLILTIFEKKDEKKDEKTKKKKEQQAVQKQPQEVQQVPKEEVWQLLYSSFQLFSDNAKKNQIILMQNVIIKIKQIFNKQFNKLLKFRQSQNELLNDKNKRIIQICDQLKRSHQVITSKKNILENPDSILEVKNKDVPFPRYLSRQEKQKLQKERQKQQERLRALAEDDSSQRALQKMMGGTLQEKKTSVLEVQIQREKWMDKPIQQMTQQEKNKMKQYEQKKQKAQQQRQRIIKKLQAELRKLKSQIDDIMEKYDEKLFNLLVRRIQYDLRIQQQQLYCIRLALSILNFKDEQQKFKQLTNKQALYVAKIQKLQTYRDQLRGQQEQLQKGKQAKHASLDMKRLGDAQTKVKTIQKSVFEQYNNNIKKRRQLQDKLLQSDQIAQCQIINLDPMKQIQSKILSNQNVQQFKFFLPQIKNLQQTYDFPDSLLNILQSRFNIRKEQADFERKLRGVKESLKKLEEGINQKQNSKQDDQKQLQKIKNYLQKSKSDLQVQIRIKKGFVQIDSETPVPKLDDALLISKPEIDQKNSSILSQAAEKIQVMKKIKTCKIKVTQQTLQLQRKQALIDQTSTMIKQVQMLKVKKEMQTALAKKDTKINENELRSLKEQIQKVRKQGQKRISLFEKKIQKVNQQIDTIRKQNKQLQVQKWNLQNTVKQREKIKDMMVGQNGGGNQQASQKFDQISINRKLFDKAKQQTDQIELLREELSKLKAKTFANFSSVQR